MAVQPRDARAMKLTGGDKLEVFGEDRTCAVSGCGIRLSRYNPAEKCSRHAGWIEPVKRRA